jgi:hypothetical protein
MEANPARKAAAKIAEAMNKKGGKVIRFSKTGEAGA